MYHSFFKRLFDVLFSLIGILLLFIPFLIVALLIKIDDGGDCPRTRIKPTFTLIF